MHSYLFCFLIVFSLTMQTEIHQYSLRVNKVISRHQLVCRRRGGGDRVTKNRKSLPVQTSCTCMPGSRQGRPVRQVRCARWDHLASGWLSSNFASSLRGVEIKGPLHILRERCLKCAEGKS